MGERKGRVKSRNMYKGSMDKYKGWGMSLGAGVGWGRREQRGENEDKCN